MNGNRLTERRGIMQSMEYKERDSVRFSHLGRDWHIYRADMESLWQSMDQDQEAMQAFAEDERLPYWAELWPSSFGLASWLLCRRKLIFGKKCLDLGCGLGFTALCGVSLGARVLGCDYEEKALELASFNARKNGVPLCFFSDYLKSAQASFCPLHMDWRNPLVAPKSFSFVWAADIAYERKFMPDILKFLDYALADDGIFWIAEPGRSIYAYFLEEAKAFPFRIAKVHEETTPRISDNILSARVNIWELARI